MDKRVNYNENDEAQNMQRSNPEAVLQSAEEINQLQEKTKSKFDQANSHFKNDDMSQYISCTIEAIALMQQIQAPSDQDRKRLTRTHKNLGIVYHKQNQYRDALTHLNKAIETAKLIQALSDQDRRVLLDIHNHLGQICINQNQYQDSIPHCNNAIETGKLIQALSDKDRSVISRAYCTLGERYAKLNQYRDAIPHFNNAIALIKSIENLTLSIWLETIKTCMNISIVYSQANAIEKSQETIHFTLNLLMSKITGNYSRSNCQTIQQCYDRLRSLALPHSLEQQVYSFANNTFLTNPFPTFTTEYQQLLLAVLGTPFSPVTTIHQRFYQWMKFVEKASPDDTNPAVKTYFSNQVNLEEFKNDIKRVEQAFRPETLLGTISQGPNFYVSIAQKLISLQDENKKLKETIEQFQKQLESQQKTIYGNGPTMFSGGSSNTSSVSSDKPDQKRVFS